MGTGRGHFLAKKALAGSPNFHETVGEEQGSYGKLT